MQISEDLLKLAFEKAGGKCECRNDKHEHLKRRCNRNLIWKNKGKGEQGVWEVRVRGKGTGIGDVEIVCWKCFKQPRK